MENKVRMEKEVIKVLKNNENIVRDAAEKKKNVMIYGLKEKVISMRTKREKEGTKCIKEILKQLNDEDENTKFEKEVEEIMRLGPYIEGDVRLKTQSATEEILARTYKLRDIVEYKDVFIKKNMNEEERQQFRKLNEEAKQKNIETTTKKTKIFWRVKNNKIMKWYITNRY